MRRRMDDTAAIRIESLSKTYSASGMPPKRALEEVSFDHDLESVPTHDCFEDIRLLDERTMEITYRKDKVNAGQVLAAIQRDGLSIVDVRTREPDLEDVFLSLVSRPEAA